MKTFSLIAVLALTITTSAHAAKETDYKPGGPEWAKTWKAFYNNPGSEEDLPKPLIKAGPKMTPAIVEAISNKDMRLRRYAIGALGHLKDRRALDQLTIILKEKGEEEYFRGDALIAIYQIDQKLGTELAKQFAGQGDTIKMNAEAILKKEPWLLAQ